MALITLRELTIGFRGPLLLDHVSCQIDPSQRIGLLGRNGSGKTTLLRILRGELEPDHGQLLLGAGTTVSMLPQDVPPQLQGVVLDVVGQGLARTNEHDQPTWKKQQCVEQILSRMQLDGEPSFDTLSSGMKRRVLLARALVGDPDVLLLDEPTNHLDIATIAWLEGFLSRWDGTLIFVTHDRMFLRKLATRILEIDRGRLFDWSCDYQTFVKRKEAALLAEEKQNALFDKKLAQEETWIRQGIKARRTRNEGRVRALEDMRRQRRGRRANDSKVRLRIDEGQRSGNLVADLDNVSFAYDNRVVVSDFSTTIMRGDKVGIIGPNGAGKTTLLSLLLGQLRPDAGTVRLGTNLRIAYFDQLRQQLDENASVVDNVGHGYDTVQIGGKPKHIIGYLRDFLFTADRAQTEVRFLSGGERNRILLARLFAKPANVIVLDEPTNDLDTETLELLEERLVQFEGTVLLVSHDRAFLNNIVTSTIAFEPDGIREYVGGYDDWLRQRSETAADCSPRQKKQSDDARRATGESSLQTGRAGRSANPRKRKLSYKERQELAALPAAIKRLEIQIGELHDAMARPAFYQQPGEALARAQAELQGLEEELNIAYQRWEELEMIASE